MLSNFLLQSVKTWLKDRQQIPLSLGSTDQVPVIGLPDPKFEVRAVSCDGHYLIVARDSWTSELGQVCANLEPELLFSVFGAYELGRVAVPRGFSIWGPSWWLFADQTSWHSRISHDIVQLSAAELAKADQEVFWHCYTSTEAVAAFGICLGGDLRALATVRDLGQPFMEIGVDVAPNEQTKGFGRSVVSAAGDWILQQGCFPVAGTAPFNIPSARVLRSVGLAHGFSDMVAMTGPFRVPPQPLGKPTTDADLVDHYPEWALNSDIRRR